MLCAVFHPMKTKSLANYANSLCEIKTPTVVAIRQLINTNRSWSHETSTTTYRIIRQMLEIEIDICHSFNELIVDRRPMSATFVRWVSTRIWFVVIVRYFKVGHQNTRHKQFVFFFIVCLRQLRIGGQSGQRWRRMRRWWETRSFCAVSVLWDKRNSILGYFVCAMSAQSQSQIMIVWIVCDNGRCRICVEEN